MVSISNSDRDTIVQLLKLLVQELDGRANHQANARRMAKILLKKLSVKEKKNITTNTI
jgi:hypothetical protein|nr:MAG TPA: hypothetical protein [Caudoviricetes sp.]